VGNLCSNPASSDLPNYFHAHFWLTAKKRTILGDCDMTAASFIICSNPWDLQWTYFVTLVSYLKGQKGKTTWKRLSHSHGVALWPFIIPMSQTLLVYLLTYRAEHFLRSCQLCSHSGTLFVYNWLYEVVGIVIIIIFILLTTSKITRKNLCF
jgi:hypothetical protein